MVKNGGVSSCCTSALIWDLYSQRSCVVVRALLNQLFADITPQDREFEFHAGDIIFLVRNVIFHGPPEIAVGVDPAPVRHAFVL